MLPIARIVVQISSDVEAQRVAADRQQDAERHRGAADDPAELQQLRQRQHAPTAC